MRLLAIATVALLTICSCNNNSEDYNTGVLQVSDIVIENKEMKTRAALWGTSFPQNTKIGVTITKTAQDEVVSNNSCWTLSENSWKTTTPVYLSPEDHTAYAYYPYIPSMTNPEAVPVAYDQSDYVCGRSASTGLNSGSGRNKATFSMVRSMTRVAVFIKKATTYKGEGMLTHLCLRNAPQKQLLLTDASLLKWNIKTGKFSYDVLPAMGSSLKMYQADNEIAYPVKLPSTIGANSVGDVIFAPVSSFQDGDIEICVTVDNQEYIVPVPTPRGLDFADANGGWKAGYNYRYSLALTPKHLTLSSILINDWIEITDPTIVIH